MPVYTSEALILRTYKLGEADRIVVFLTRDRGKKRGVAKGARRPKSRFTGALEPMTRAGVAYLRAGAARPGAAELCRTAAVTALGGIRRCVRACGLLRRTDRRMGSRVARGRAVVPPGSVGHRRGHGRRARGCAGSVFRGTWILRLQGVYPAFSCATCGGSLQSGATMPARDHDLVCRGCAPAGGTGLSVPALRFLISAGSVAPDCLEPLGLTPQASRELETVHRRLLTLHLEKELKSARVLREMRQAR